MVKAPILLGLILFLATPSLAQLTVTIEPSAPRAPAGVQFQTVGHASGGTPPYRFEWFVGNERTGTINQANNWTFNNEAEYLIRVVVTDARGRTGEGFAQVIIGQTPAVEPEAGNGLRPSGNFNAGPGEKATIPSGSFSQPPSGEIIDL